MGKLTRVISGGQSGSDQAGVRAAKSLGIATGGWLPKGWLTEDGSRPEFAEMYGMREHVSPAYPPRTHQNAADADITIWVGRTGSPGYWCTKKGCTKAGRPFREFTEPFPDESMMFIVADRIVSPPQDRDYSINIAGPRESTQPGIGERAEVFLTALLKELAKEFS